MELFDTPLIISKNYGLGIEQRFFKRCFDILLSSIGIIIASPFMLITAVAIKLCDHGPVLYKQVRLTKHLLIKHGAVIAQLYRYRTLSASKGEAIIIPIEDRRMSEATLEETLFNTKCRNFWR